MKKKIFSISLLCSILFLISACSTPKTTTEPVSDSTVVSEMKKETEDKINVSIRIDAEDKNIAEKDLEVSSGASLMDIMKDNFEVIDEGGFITSIEGVEQKAKDNLFWTYKINDEEVMTGAEDTTLNEGDKVVFTYAQFK